MRQSQGHNNTPHIELINPVQNKWLVRWNYQPIAYSELVSFIEEEFKHKPTIEEIKALIFGWIDAQVDERILHGFRYNGTPVTLDAENKFNYKASFDLVAQTGGQGLPITFRLGTEQQPVYQEFNTMQELTAFYTAAMTHVQQCYVEGWQQKAQFDFEAYQKA